MWTANRILKNGGQAKATCALCRAMRITPNGNLSLLCADMELIHLYGDCATTTSTEQL